MIRETVTALGDFLFPRVCHVCGVSLAGKERYICTSCLSRLPRTLFHRIEDNPMERRFIGLVPFERATGYFFYSPGSDLSVLMQDLKYHGCRGLARFLGEIVGAELSITGFFSDIDLIIPVPVHFWKKARRGYNQTEEIARGISEATGIPVGPILRAVRPHRSQTTLSHEERRNNTTGVFSLDLSRRLRATHALIIDDVCTTGSTLLAAAQAVKAGAPHLRISLLSIGVTF